MSWRLCLSLQIVAPLLLLIGSPWLPESPRWLIARSDHKSGENERKALEVLRKLHVKPGDTSDIAAKEEYYQIRKQIELENQTGVTSFAAMLKRPSYRKRMLCGILVQYAAFPPVRVVPFAEFSMQICCAVDGSPRGQQLSSASLRQFRFAWMAATTPL